MKKKGLITLASMLITLTIDIATRSPSVWFAGEAKLPKNLK